MSSSLALLPLGASADVLELSQSQMRQLVSQQQVLSAESIILGATQSFDGTVVEIRGFLSEGQMTYRLLMRQPDGMVTEVLVNGVSGRQVLPSSQMGKVVSTTAVSSTTSETETKHANSTSVGSSSTSNSNASSNNQSSNGARNSNSNTRSATRGNGNSNSNNRNNSRNNGNSGKT